VGAGAMKNGLRPGTGADRSAAVPGR
jgi:hypothetical protein